MLLGNDEIYPIQVTFQLLNGAIKLATLKSRDQDESNVKSYCSSPGINTEGVKITIEHANDMLILANFELRINMKNEAYLTLIDNKKYTLGSMINGKVIGVWWFILTTFQTFNESTYWCDEIFKEIVALVDEIY